MLGEAIDDMHGLHGMVLKKLHYFIKHELKIPKYEIAVDKEKLTILVSPLLPDGKPLFMKEKDETLFKRLVTVLGIKDWKIRFAEREDYEAMKLSQS